MSTTSDPFSISGRRTVITGGTSGIGRAVAEHFVAAGAPVVITGRRDTGDEVAADIGARFVRMDVTDDESVRLGMDEAAGALGGGIDVLILNAGGAVPCGPLREMDLDDYRATMEVNFGGALRGLRFGLDHMARGSVVIMTSSPGGRQALGIPGLSSYGASKAAVDFLVRSAGLELAGEGIRVSGVLPGFISTGIDETGEAAWLADLTATGQAQEPAAIAPVYHYLASDAGALLQGSLVAADDGCTAGLSAPVIQSLMRAH